MSDSFRAKIVDAFAERMTELFGPAGSRGQIFRTVKRGQWQPFVSPMNCCTIADDGCARIDDADGTSTNQLLNIKAICEIEYDWSREGKTAEWSDHVDAIKKAFQHWRPAGCGVLQIRATGDDPFEVYLISSGKSGNVWVIEFEAEYFDEALDLFNNTGE